MHTVQMHSIRMDPNDLDSTGLAPCLEVIPKLSQNRWVAGQPGQCLVMISFLLMSVGDQS